VRPEKRNHFMTESGAFKLAQLSDRGTLTLCQGGPHALVMIPRTANGKPINPLLEIWVEDDENWFHKQSLDLSFAAALGEALLQVSSAGGLPPTAPHVPNGGTVELRAAHDRDLPP
jgi:hypothetical protein